ncbi:hypothetical protein PENFLA_c054G09288 [Penicillium flavigenum]|uniref:Uncharacterized protein n=1 Tax=Penicillium flavigenum TaxID=254877 RepID=A0A1V6SH93_9EURO|nr:hypothetical protein PENFLA_c054G09288 [Penicillium flavigenum]
MAITNTIHIEAHMGSVDGISVIWGPNLATTCHRTRRTTMWNSASEIGSPKENVLVLMPLAPTLW